MVDEQTTSGSAPADTAATTAAPSPEQVTTSAGVPPVPAAPRLELPPSAGVRAERRVRPGVSLGVRGWIAAAFTLAPAIAASVLYLATPAAAPSPASLPLALDDIDTAVGQIREAQAAVREQTQTLLGTLAQQIAQSVPAAATTATAAAAEPDPEAEKPADPLPALRKQLDELARANPTLRGVLVDRGGSILHATGDLPADAPALKSAVAALIAGDALPSTQTGTASRVRADGLRVLLLAGGPSVDDSVLDGALTARRQAQRQAEQAATQLVERSAQIEALAQRWLLATATIGATALLALLAIALLLLRPLQRSLHNILLRTSERASGVVASTPASLPGELAAVDDLVGRAFDAVATQAADVRDRAELERALVNLSETCRRAAGGDLAVRAAPPPGPVGTLAMELNLLVESFERRALRLRGHLTAPASDSGAAPGDDLDNLRQRSAALNPMAQLLSDIASRLQLFAANAARGEPVEADLKKLADAVAARSKTARAYLAALNDAIGGLDSGTAGGARLQQLLEQELAALQVETTFPRLIEANREQPLDEIKRRIDAAQAPPPPNDAE